MRYQLLFAPLVLAIVFGCASATTGTAPCPGQFGAECGADKPVCADGLECFGVCTFECGYKYSAAGEYGFDQESVDLCTEHSGRCQQYDTGVQINVCVP